MAEKKAATRKSKKRATRKQVQTTEGAPDSSAAAADETVSREETTAVEERETTRIKKRRSGAKRRRAARRSTKKAAAGVKPGAAGPTEQRPEPLAEEAAASSGVAAAPPAKKKRTRRRRGARTRRIQVAEAGQTKAETPSSQVRPMSTSAEVVRSDDTIVIRFPAVGALPTPLAARQEAAKPAGAVAGPASADEAAIEPPIDWEAAAKPASFGADQDTDAEPPPFADEPGTHAAVPASTEPRARDDGRAAPPDEAETLSEPTDGKRDTEAVRPKRRRRRKRRDPRLAPEKATPQAERAEAEAERRRPEPAAEPADAVEPAVEEKQPRRRRRRSRRGRRQGAAAATEAGDPATAERVSKPEPRAAASKALRPTGEKEMIINVVPREECRIAIMENGKLEEIHLERASTENYVGNIYKGIVTNVESSIQAAFVDFGRGKNGFLHISDLHPQYFADGAGSTENVGRKMPRRNRPPIQRCLRRGQELLVQITKEGIGTKGPTLTTYLSIPGRFLVMMPGMRQLGVSRKIEDEEVRRKLRDQLRELNLPENIGFIARTAAMDHTKRELQGDLSYLSRLWKAVEKRIKNEKPPVEIYTESDLVIRTIRDVYTSDISRIVVDDPDVAQRAHEFLTIFSPRSRDTVVEYDGPQPIFHRYGIEAELDRLHSRHVPLKSGGSLVIDQTEALVAIDVNSGRFRTEDDAEATAYKIDLEAADEIARQLRLRDLGGVIICDFIDVRLEKHKREIERRLSRNLKQHKERAKLLRMSDFGIIELTRQRQRASLTRSIYQDCQHCRGTGLVKTAESVVLDVMRLIRLAVTHDNIRTIEVSVSPQVAHLLQNRKRAQLHQLEEKNRRSISVRTEPGYGLDQIDIQCKDARARLVPHP